MTFTTMMQRHMSFQSAQFAQANGSCAHTASMQSANSIIMTMDAMILASIIISLLGILALVRVSLVLVVLVSAYFHTPDRRGTAYL